MATANSVGIVSAGTITKSPLTPNPVSGVVSAGSVSKSGTQPNAYGIVSK